MSKLLDDYPWLQPSWQQLQEAKQSGRLAHALLFVASEGIGVESLVQTFVASEVCETLSKEGDPCGHCKPCMLLANNTHADVHWIDVLEGKQSISVEQVRDLNQSAVQTAQRGAKKFYSIKPIEKMTINAANALLKTLEEPVADTFFLLICHQPENLLATIRSRCQLIKIQTPNLQQARDWVLTRSTQYAVADIETALWLANFQPLSALVYLQQGIERPVQVLESLVGLPLGQLNLSQVEFDFKRVEAWQWTEIFYQLIRQLIALVQTGLAEYPRYLAPLAVHSQAISLKALYNSLDQLIEIRQALMKKSNLNIELALQATLSDWARLITKELQHG